MQRGEYTSLLGVWVVGVWATPSVTCDLASDQPEPCVLTVLDGHGLGVLCAGLRCPELFHCPGNVRAYLQTPALCHQQWQHQVGAPSPRLWLEPIPLLGLSQKMQMGVGAASLAPGETREKENRETQGSLGSPGNELNLQSLAPLSSLFPRFPSDLEPFGEDGGIFKKQDYRSPLF